MIFFALATVTTKRRKKNYWILANWQTLSVARTEATFILNLFAFSNTAQVNNKGTKQSNCCCCAVRVDYVRHDHAFTFRRGSLVCRVFIFSQPQKMLSTTTTTKKLIRRCSMTIIHLWIFFYYHKRPLTYCTLIATLTSL